MGKFCASHKSAALGPLLGQPAQRPKGAWMKPLPVTPARAQRGQAEGASKGSAATTVKRTVSPTGEADGEKERPTAKRLS